MAAGDLYTLLLYFLIFVIVQAVLFSYDYDVTDEKETFIKQLSWTPLSRLQLIIIEQGWLSQW